MLNATNDAKGRSQRTASSESGKLPTHKSFPLKGKK
jgi:hypothetical protein